MQGKEVSGYTLQRLLGAGGMAEVWLAENAIGMKAAVKILLPKFCDDESVVERFANEAKVMVRLHHTNIRQVYNYGFLDGRPCIIMEYLEGEDLKARMKHGQRFTDAELVRWWNQLADALNYTHAKGIVHRDIKPGNIFVDNDGDIKLLDFGIAKVRASISSTQTGQKIGTLMYMSPEQVKDSKHIDHRTDLYSLAVTFVHLVTGKKPYDSDTSSDFEISNQIVFKPLDLSGLPEKWRLFLEPYLNKEPQDRPALKHFSAPAPKSAEEEVPSMDAEATIVGNAVKQRPAPEPAPVPKAPVSTGTPKPAKKRSKTIVFVLAGVVVAALLALLLWPHAGMKGEYIDLGLPSGTLWKNTNEENPSDKKFNFFTYEEAMSQFGSSLPSEEQWKELQSECQWTWTGSGYKVTGPNGNSITLPAAGYRNCGGSVDYVGSYGRYWSSTPDGSDNAWRLGFYSGSVDMYYNYRCYGQSVRLVQD